MPKRTNKIQVCKIDGSDPIIRLKGWTPAGAYINLTEEAKKQLGDVCLTEYCQYQEIGEATVNTETGEVVELTISE